MNRTTTHIEIEGKDVVLSNLDKVLYPKAAFTKAQVIDYYIRIAPVLLPHLRGRPVTLKRFPEGVQAGHFYEKRCPFHRPAWVDLATVQTNGKPLSYCSIDSLASLVWVANLASLELHVLLARPATPLQPDAIVFDLDPGPGTNLVDCCRLALRLRKRLDELGLAGFPKTSGSKGLHVYVPLNTPVTYEQTKSFSRALALSIERDDPLATTQMQKSARAQRVFIDWSQNDPHKTTVCVYSLRAQPQPTVSAPVSWAQIASVVKRGDPSLLAFEAGQVLQRVARLGDLFTPVLTLKQTLPDEPRIAAPGRRRRKAG